MFDIRFLWALLHHHHCPILFPPHTHTHALTAAVRRGGVIILAAPFAHSTSYCTCSSFCSTFSLTHYSLSLGDDELQFHVSAIYTCKCISWVFLFCHFVVSTQLCLFSGERGGGMMMMMMGVMERALYHLTCIYYHLMLPEYMFLIWH